MRHCLWLLLFSITYLSSFSLSANETDITFNTATEEEALFVRRIIEFYQEEETELFLNQVNEFLSKHPKSPLCNDLYALLGDYYMEEKNFDKSSKYFAKIRDGKVLEKIIVNYLQALYNLQNYSKSAKVASKYLDRFSELDIDKHNSIHFFYAEALYRQSLESDLDKENRAKIALDAIREFEGLVHTKLSIQAMGPLAHLYYLFKKFALSANTYIKLSEKDSENKEFYLFQAANIEAKFDKDKAIQTFTQICHLGKSCAPDAAYNRMVLLYEAKHFPELILAKDQLARLLDNDKKPLLHFFLGKSHLNREDYKRSEHELKEFLKAEGFSKERKNALLSLAEIAQINESIELFSDIITMYENEYDDVEEYSDLLLSSAIISKKKKDYHKAEEQFEKVLKLDIPNEKKATAEFEYAHVLFLNKKCSLSRQNFAQFFKTNSDHVNNIAALHFLLASSNELVKDPKSDFSKQDFCNDLEETLSQKCLKDTFDEQKYRFLLAKTYFEINEFEKSINTLKPLLIKCNSKSISSEALVLNGYCLKQLSRPALEYLKFFEEALKINPKMEERGKIHLILYNAFLQLSEKDKKDAYLAKAAHHLYKAHLSNETILRENLLWASDYFSHESKDYKKSIALLERAISLNDFAASASELEDAIIKLSRLYQELNIEDKYLALLDRLEKEYLKSPDAKWKYVQNVRYELGKNYEKRQQLGKAIMYYDDVFQGGLSLRGFIQAKSCLQSARLRLSLLEKNAYTKKNPEIIKVLNQLKDLTIQKSLDNEPIHLEAAIEYVELLCKIENLSETSQKKLTLLKNIKETFTSKDTVIDKEYHERRESNSVKNQIFEHYMKFLEGEIMLCEEGNFDKTEISSSFENLIDQANLSDFLKDRIYNHMKKFQTSNVLTNPSDTNES